MKSSRKSQRLVAIVGRPNVGKSALFNRLAGRRIAIVHDQPGVTRDRLTAPVKDAGFPLEVMDTGGIGATLEDDFGAIVRAEAEIAIAAADVILFVVDALAGMHPIDQSVAELLRRQGKPVVLGLNKADAPVHDHLAADFGRLGFQNVVAFSAEHGRNIPELIRVLEREAGPPPAAGEEESGAETDPEQAMKVAIIGRPNVGKSSLFNAILGDDRAIVSNVAGTTRDAIDSLYTHQGKSYLLIDTAGIRKRGKVDTTVEAFSVRRSERAIRRADLCALVIDSARGVTAQERKIAGTIVEENKPCVIVANKFDLFHPTGRMKARLEELEEHVRRELFFLHYAPLVAVSAKNSQNLNKIFAAIERVRKASDEAMSTGQFNRLLQQAIEKTPPPMLGGRRFKLLYATLAREEKPRPVMAPRVVLFVNHEELMTPTYRRYLENTVRQTIPYEGLPIRFDVRSREKKAENKATLARKRAAEAAAKPKKLKPAPAADGVEEITVVEERAERKPAPAVKKPKGAAGRGRASGKKGKEKAGKKPAARSSGGKGKAQARQTRSPKKR